ncbi:hypothetical protein CPB83DRAFT_899315 [Crepidotus variabilis]|uniref:Uncharacterized protein n=1 Tax=Crepidotus variabilis TaxID=179855 RepID=A0A9P6JJ03_9AGAR|nr:hypothetical protein CPB83DRAFT_899315 [Crepidotus variabilis]
MAKPEWPAIALFKPGSFCGSNGALYTGQSIADMHISDYFQPAPLALEWPHGSGQNYHVRLVAKIFHQGFTDFYLEMTTGGPGVANAVWHPAPLHFQLQLQVLDCGTVQHLAI